MEKFSYYRYLLFRFDDFYAEKFVPQVAVPSRTDVKEYQELKEEIDKLVGCINGQFSTPSWSPIR